MLRHSLRHAFTATLVLIVSACGDRDTYTLYGRGTYDLNRTVITTFDADRGGGHNKEQCEKVLEALRSQPVHLSCEKDAPKKPRS